MIEKLNGKADGKPFDIFPYVTLCTLDIICGELEGKEGGCVEDVMLLC